MKRLTEQDIEEQLSYAYLHAVASRAGAGCEVAGRARDAHGIDAQVTVWGDFPGSYLKEITFNIQLKATKKIPARKKGFVSYSLQGIDRYKQLREDCHSVKRFLVVLFLPEDASEWLTQSTDALVLKRCAWWSSLVTAPDSSNATSQTVYMPESQIFNVPSVNQIAENIAAKNPPTYHGHELHT